MSFDAPSAEALHVVEMIRYRAWGYRPIIGQTGFPPKPVEDWKEQLASDMWYMTAVELASFPAALQHLWRTTDCPDEDIYDLTGMFVAKVGLVADVTELIERFPQRQQTALKALKVRQRIMTHVIPFRRVRELP